jgi:hypothetical protein
VKQVLIAARVFRRRPSMPHALDCHNIYPVCEFKWVGWGLPHHDLMCLHRD